MDPVVFLQVCGINVSGTTNGSSTTTSAVEGRKARPLAWDRKFDQDARCRGEKHDQGRDADEAWRRANHSLANRRISASRSREFRATASDNVSDIDDEQNQRQQERDGAPRTPRYGLDKRKQRQQAEHRKIREKQNGEIRTRAVRKAASKSTAPGTRPAKGSAAQGRSGCACLSSGEHG